MDIVVLKNGDPQFPLGPREHIGDHAPKSIAALGDLGILKGKILGFFCSVKCPGHLILKTHDLAQQLKKANVTVIGGFHSPIERECLRILLRGTQSIIICPARSLSGMRIRGEYEKPIEEGRLLLLSPFKKNQGRNTIETAMERNRFVAALADSVFVAHASPNSKMEKFCHEVLRLGKPLYTFESEANKFLINIGAKPLSASNLDLLIS